MLTIRSAAITDVPSLQTALQNAIKLEHATIPPYLTAYYTLRGSNPAVAYARRSIRTIVNQEMLHFTLACNVLNAINGTPEIADAGFVPNYPDHLPMGVEDSLIVHLKRYSRDVVRNTFMTIEEPEAPLPIPVKAAVAFAATEIRTIGQFYAAIAAQIRTEGDGIFVGDPARQVTGTLGATAVTNVDSAIVAIKTIVEQGEGTSTSPAATGTAIAHYYRFEELSKGMKIVPDATSPVGFSFDPQQPLAIDDVADVIQMVDDPQTITFDPADAAASQLADACDKAYSDLLKILQDAFNGQPNRINDAIDQMTLVLEGAIQGVLGGKLVAGPYAGLFAGPRFKFVP